MLVTTQQMMILRKTNKKIMMNNEIRNEKGMTQIPITATEFQELLPKMPRYKLYKRPEPKPEKDK